MDVLIFWYYCSWCAESVIINIWKLEPDLEKLFSLQNIVVIGFIYNFIILHKKLELIPIPILLHNLFGLKKRLKEKIKHLKVRNEIESQINVFVWCMCHYYVTKINLHKLNRVAGPIYSMKLSNLLADCVVFTLSLNTMVLWCSVKCKWNVA